MKLSYGLVDALFQKIKLLKNNSTPLLIHPDFKDVLYKHFPHYKNSGLCMDLQADFIQWKKHLETQVLSYLNQNKTYFDFVSQKKTLAKYIVSFYLDIGMDPTWIQSLNHPKFAQLTKLFSTLDTDCKTSPIDSAWIGLGFSYDFHYLCFLQHQYKNHPDAELYLLDHNTYPSWITQKPIENFTHSYPLINQFQYSTHRQIFDFLFSTLDHHPDEKIAFVVDHPHIKKWIQHQCDIRKLDHQKIILDQFSKICHHSFHTVYIVDSWFETTQSSPIWTHDERAALQKQKCLASDYTVLKSWLALLTKQCENIYFLFQDHKEAPSLFNNPFETKDPLPDIGSPHNDSNADILKPCVALHDKIVHEKTWNQDEVDFLEHGKKPATLSASSLMNLARCPRQFFYQYVLGIQGRPMPEEPFAQIRTEFGTMIHDFLQRVFEQSSTKALQAIFEDEKTKIMHEFSQKLPQNYQALWKKEMQFYFENLYPYIQNQFNDAFTPKQFEHSFFADAQITQGITSKTYTHSFKGQIDRIDQHKDIYRIVDYKTGKLQKKKTDLLENGLFLQMPLYLLYFIKKYPNIDHQAEIHQISALGVEVIAPFTASFLQDHFTELGQILDRLLGMIEQMHFVPDPGKNFQHCRSCSYQTFCGSYLQQSVSSKEGRL